MRITKLADVEVGHFLTFIVEVSDYAATFGNLTEPKFKRRILKVKSISITSDNKYKFECDDYSGTETRIGGYFIDNLFEHELDDVYETREEIKYAYPEEFI